MSPAVTGSSPVVPSTCRLTVSDRFDETGGNDTIVALGAGNPWHQGNLITESLWSMPLTTGTA